MKKLAMVLMLLLAPAMSYAAGPFYRSGNLYTSYNLVHFKDFGAGSVTGYEFQTGYDITPWLALEGHVGLTNEVKQNLTSGGDYINTKVRASYGSIAGRFNLRFDRTTVFGFVGVTYLQENGRVDYSIGGVPGSAKINDSDTGATYGVGVDLYGSESAAISFKAARVYKAKGNNATISNDLDTAMLGFTYYIQ